MKKSMIVVVTCLLVLVSQVVCAANVGVSPANIHFKNVLRSGYAERPLTITIDTLNPTPASTTAWGDIAEWISVSSSSFSVSKDNTARLIVSVTPPSDIPNGNYSGFIRINSSRLAENADSGASSAVLPVLDVSVTVEVTDDEVIACRAGNFQIFSAETGEDIIFTSVISNDGNVRFYPNVKFEIWDQESTTLVKEYDYAQSLVFPTRDEEVVVRIPSAGLPIGQYWVKVSALDCYFEQTLTFDVLEKGALRAELWFDRIVVQPWADVDEIVPISIPVKNVGQKPVDARFSGKVLLNNKIVQLLESDKPLFVPLAGDDAFQFYITPREAGKYIITGRVFYESKRSYEQTGVLNVRPKGSIIDRVLKIVVYGVLLIIIAILIYKIRRERESYMAKWRMMRR